MQIKVTEHLGDLEADQTRIAEETPRRLHSAVSESIREGNRIGKAFAKESAGSHGKLYPLAWSAEMTGLLRGEYGPDADKPQGGMSFERGSRNQPPHLDKERSADIEVPKFYRRVDDVVDGLPW